MKLDNGKVCAALIETAPDKGISKKQTEMLLYMLQDEECIPVSVPAPDLRSIARGYASAKFCRELEKNGLGLRKTVEDMLKDDASKRACFKHDTAFGPVWLKAEDPKKLGKAHPSEGEAPALEPGKDYVFATPYGKFRVSCEDDGQYQGVDVEFEPTDLKPYDDDQSPCTLPRCLFEIDGETDRKIPRALVWANPFDEDFTNEVECEHPDDLAAAAKKLKDWAKENKP